MSGSANTGAPIMHAFLIDATSATITRVTLPDQGDRLPPIYRLIGCETITAVPFDYADTIYVDDEALLKSPAHHLFAAAGYPQPIVGNGLVVGTTSNGADAPPRVSLARLQRRIRFIERVTDTLCVLRGYGRRPVLANFQAVIRTLAQEAA